MAVDLERLKPLVADVGRYHISDRRMRRTQERFAARLEKGTVSTDDASAYVRAVRDYFTGFEREARAHLADVERRLARVSQVQFNLTAERGVAARRVAATQGVLSHIEEVGRP
jgi:hypothetical protein